jgi:hypothetical protein
MTVIEQELLTMLRELDSTVRQSRAAKVKPSLLPLFGRLDDLALRLPAEADPTLAHYMQRKSYEKARLYLEGRESENQEGACRH